MVGAVDLVNTGKQYPNAMTLVDGMLAGNIDEVRPVIDLSTELGFTYPQVESLFGITTQEATSMLELLVNNQVLEKHFIDKLLFCPHCLSPNLRPSLQCPKCGSVNIDKGRILEHFSCGNIGLENEYRAAEKYMCPKCNRELRFLATDYRSLGVNYKCHDCGEIASDASLRWQCLKCQFSFANNEANETVICSYQVNEEKRAELEFDLGTKARLIEFLKNHGYEVTERVKVTGTSKSGAVHTLDILAHRDDGLVTCTVGIGVLIDNKGQDIELERIFAFDDKAYDLGINDKVLLASPRLTPEAKQFAQRQRIKVFEGKELDTFLASTTPSVSRKVEHKPLRFDNKAMLLSYLRSLGYKVEGKAKVQGRSGAEHVMDILASYDNGFITNTIGIDVIAAKDKVSFNAIASFDTKAYDLGIHQKVLLISPGLSPEAKKFAQYQKIKVIDVNEPTKLNSTKLSHKEAKHE